MNGIYSNGFDLINAPMSGIYVIVVHGDLPLAAMCCHVVLDRIQQFLIEAKLYFRMTCVNFYKQT